MASRNSRAIKGVFRKTGSNFGKDSGKIIENLSEPHEGKFEEKESEKVIKATFGKQDFGHINKKVLKKVSDEKENQQEKDDFCKGLRKFTENLMEPNEDLFDEEATSEDERPENLMEPNEDLFDEEATSEDERPENLMEPNEDLFDEEATSEDERPENLMEPNEDLFDEEATSEDERPENLMEPNEDLFDEEATSEDERPENLMEPNEDLFDEEAIGEDERLENLRESFIKPEKNSLDESCKSEKVDAKEKNNISQKEPKVQPAEARNQGNVGEILYELIKKDLVLCMDGKDLFIKNNESYVSISFSTESEIMYLKRLLRRYDWKLNLSQYKMLLYELKTEPDIWIENIERNGSQYEVHLCGGRIMYGVEGKFNDFLVQGQIHTKRKPFTDGILLFVDECCKLDTSVQVGSSELFGVYQSFMDEYPGYFRAKQNQFVPFLKKEFGLWGGSTGKLRVLKGICMKEVFNQIMDT